MESIIHCALTSSPQELILVQNIWNAASLQEGDMNL